MRYASWIITFIIIGLVYFALKDVLMKKIKKPAAKVIIGIVKFLLALAMALGTIAIDIAFFWKLGRPLCILYIFMLCDVFADAICGILYLIPAIKAGAQADEKTWYRVRRIFPMICSLVFFIYGTINMQNVYQVDLTYTSDKLAGNHDFVYMADIHAGMAQDPEVFSEVIDEIEALNPEFVVLGGDVVDEYTKKDEMEQVFDTIGKLTMPVYYVYGNHDRQALARLARGEKAFTEEELVAAMEKNGITILKDEWTYFSDDLLIVGRQDMSCDDRIPSDELEVPETDAFVLNLDHQPSEFEESARWNADLQLSGHIHAGQLFPLQIVYRLIGIKTYDEYTDGDRVLYVSAGESGWNYPFRTEEHCMYNYIHLVAE